MDFVLAMTREQKESIQQLFPKAKDKTFTLKEFAGASGDIRDPIGLSVETYQKTFSEIKKAVQAVFDKMKSKEAPSGK